MNNLSNIYKPCIGQVKTQKQGTCLTAYPPLILHLIIYIRVENVHSTDMQEVTPIVVPMAVRIAISS